MSNGPDWDKFQDLTHQVMEATKGMGPAEGWPDLLGSVALNLGVRSMAAPMPNLQSPEYFLDFPAGILLKNFTYPHKLCDH